MAILAPPSLHQVPPSVVYMKALSGENSLFLSCLPLFSKPLLTGWCGPYLGGGLPLVFFNTPIMIFREDHLPLCFSATSDDVFFVALRTVQDSIWLQLLVSIGMTDDEPIQSF